MSASISDAETGRGVETFGLLVDGIGTGRWNAEFMGDGGRDPLAGGGGGGALFSVFTFRSEAEDDVRRWCRPFAACEPDAALCLGLPGSRSPVLLSGRLGGGGDVSTASCSKRDSRFFTAG